MPVKQTTKLRGKKDRELYEHVKLTARTGALTDFHYGVWLDDDKVTWRIGDDIFAADAHDDVRSAVDKIRAAHGIVAVETPNRRCGFTTMVVRYADGRSWTECYQNGRVQNMYRPADVAPFDPEQCDVPIGYFDLRHPKGTAGRYEFRGTKFVQTGVREYVAPDPAIVFVDETPVPSRATTSTKTKWIVRRVDGKGFDAWTGPMTTRVHADRECSAWVEAGTAAEVVEYDAAVRKTVREWEKGTRVVSTLGDCHARFAARQTLKVVDAPTAPVTTSTTSTRVPCPKHARYFHVCKACQAANVKPVAKVKASKPVAKTSTPGKRSEIAACTETGCTSPVHARGLCAPHYRAARKVGV